jgi:hypothetical protein
VQAHVGKRELKVIMTSVCSRRLTLELLTDVWDNVLGPKGLLSSKARILCTNAITWLPACDKIVMLRGGIVLETSTYDQVTIGA